jgi:choline dehydrogenase-like flavoprotein
MIIDLENSESAPSAQGSVCIVGAGAAGISLAFELARLGVSVTLLESGGLRHEPSTQALYDSEVSGLRHQGIHAGRFRVLGGSTTRWGGEILELDPEDFEVRQWVPGSGWPFPKSELTTYYRRALELEGLSTAILDDASVWKDLAVSAPAFGESLIPFFSRFCSEPDFTRIFGERLSENPRITIYLHANVTEIVLNWKRDAIESLKCRTVTGRQFTFSADSYVLCLGGIESARLLLQPLPEVVSAPWNSTCLVGKFFKDHIDATVMEVRPRSRRQLHQWFDNVYRGIFKYHPKLKLSVGEQKRHECLSIGAKFIFQSKREESRLEFCEAARNLRRGIVGSGELGHLVRQLPNADLLIRQVIRFKLQGRAFNPDEDGIFLRVHCEQEPESPSRITLTSDRDAVGMFRCQLDWRTSDLEIETMRRFTRIVGDVFSRDFAEVKPFPDLEQGGPELLARFDDAYHHMGTTRMASSPREGVVDPDLRLFGVRNGYVCSSSVFPSCGFSNPTHTIVALAIRLAEHLAAEISREPDAVRVSNGVEAERL